MSRLSALPENRRGVSMRSSLRRSGRAEQQLTEAQKHVSDTAQEHAVIESVTELLG